ncbi:MAG: hypothetical protein IJ678_01100, partial [Kiritimatiellae bacterium]|nr:hypothetical protein [Kiritimatiellia bacterium]
MKDTESVWNAVSAKLLEKLGAETHSKWIAALAPVPTPEEDSLVLAARDEWTKFFVDANWLPFMRDAVRECVPGATVSIVIDEAAAPSPPDPAPDGA